MRVGVGIKTWMKSSLSRICTDVILSPSGFFIQLLLGISMVLVLLIRIGNWEPHWFLGIILWFERFLRRSGVHALQASEARISLGGISTKEIW